MNAKWRRVYEIDLLVSACSVDLVRLAHTAIALHDNPSDDDLVYEVEHTRVYSESGLLSYLARLGLREGYARHFKAPLDCRRGALQSCRRRGGENNWGSRRRRGQWTRG